MPKYVVSVSMPFDTPQSVYEGDNPKEALFAWAVASYCAPKRVAIMAKLHADAKELVQAANDNILWLKEHCSLKDFPYKWEVIENSIEDVRLMRCIHFTDGESYASVYPFDNG